AVGVIGEAAPDPEEQPASTEPDTTATTTAHNPVALLAARQPDRTAEPACRTPGRLTELTDCSGRSSPRARRAGLGRRMSPPDSVGHREVVAGGLVLVIVDRCGCPAGQIADGVDQRVDVV